MKLEIDDIEQSATDTKGEFAIAGIRTCDNNRHMLVMELHTAAKLIGSLCSSGNLAMQTRGTGSTSVTTTDFPVVPTTVAAGIRSTGEVDLVLPFGQLSMSAILDPSSARSLAEQLLKAIAEGPQVRQ